MNIADTLFESASQMRELFATNIVANNGKVTQETAQEYFAVLEQLHQVANSIGISVSDFDDNMHKLHTMNFPLQSPVDLAMLTGLYKVLLDDLLKQTILYRRRYCVIRRNDPVPGLGSHMITNIGQIEAAVKAGYIPVIDMKNVNNSFCELSKSKNKNAWELFFEQPFHVSIEDIPQGSEVIYADGIPSVMPNYDMDFLTNSRYVQAWRKKCHLYMRPSIHIKNKIEAEYERLGFEGKRTLGVLCRGTDYTSLRPYNHPVQPAVEEVIEKAEAIMREYNCDYCYLVTEDEQIKAIFQTHFQERLVMSQDIYYQDVCEMTLTEMNQKKNIDFYEKNVEYLTALFLLARCQCCIGGRTSGIVSALLLADSYEDFYVWNKGRYGKDDEAFLFQM